MNRSRYTPSVSCSGTATGIRTPDTFPLEDGVITRCAEDQILPGPSTFGWCRLTPLVDRNVGATASRAGFEGESGGLEHPSSPSRRLAPDHNAAATAGRTAAKRGAG